MTTEANPIAPLHAWLAGRGRRREFWLGVAIQFIVGALFIGFLKLYGASHYWANLVTVPLWMAFAGRRLHDLGHSGWWALALLAFGWAPVVLDRIQLDSPPIETGFGLAALGAFLWLGLQRGDPAPHPFGRRPGKKSPVDVFD